MLYCTLSTVRQMITAGNGMNNPLEKQNNNYANIAFLTYQKQSLQQACICFFPISDFYLLERGTSLYGKIWPHEITTRLPDLQLSNEKELLH